jgi:hypothetical protein
MSPLWPDFALARAAWANAVKNGLVDGDQPRGDGRPESEERKPRRVRRRLMSSFAL